MNVKLRMSVLLGFVAAACGQAGGVNVNDSGVPALDGGGLGDAGVVDSGIDPGIDAGNRDAGSAQDAGPISAPPATWTWVDFPESKCASGSPLGVGVNLAPESSDVLIFLQGGGACATGAACWGPNPTALNVDRFDSTLFAVLMRKPSPLFDRTNVDNPFRKLNYVFVPYCTGDMHSGTREVDLSVPDAGIKPTYFYGANNLKLYLARLSATFPNAKRVYLAGASAGGFGAVLSFDLVRRAFHFVRVDIIDDSGPAVAPKGGGPNSALAIWGYEAPAGCSVCTSHRNVLAFDRGLQPNSRFALLTYSQDSVIAPDFGYTLAEFPAVIDNLVSSFDSHSAAFIVDGVQDHVVNGDVKALPTYMPWLTKMTIDDPTWATTHFAE